MDILSIPFHKYLNIKKADKTGSFVFKIEEQPEFLNHLGTIHACVQLSLAEATAGEFLLSQFYDLSSDLIPVVRKTEVKYHRPGKGELFSKAEFLSASRSEIIKELDLKNRVIIRVKVEVFDFESKRILSSIFDWFLTKK